MPGRLRHLLNVESGLNDGLALPVVLVLLTVVGGPDVEYAALAGELALGVAIGVVVPLIAVALLRHIEEGSRPRTFRQGGLTSARASR